MQGFDCKCHLNVKKSASHWSWRVSKRRRVYFEQTTYDVFCNMFIFFVRIQDAFQTLQHSHLYAIYWKPVSNMRGCYAAGPRHHCPDEGQEISVFCRSAYNLWKAYTSNSQPITNHKKKKNNSEAMIYCAQHHINSSWFGSWKIISENASVGTQVPPCRWTISWSSLRFQRANSCPSCGGTGGFVSKMWLLITNGRTSARIRDHQCVYQMCLIELHIWRLGYQDAIRVFQDFEGRKTRRIPMGCLILRYGGTTGKSEKTAKVWFELGWTQGDSTIYPKYREWRVSVFSCWRSFMLIFVCFPRNQLSRIESNCDIACLMMVT